MKGDEPRKVRSIRLTDSCWKAIEDAAKSRSFSSADLLESLHAEGFWEKYETFNPEEESPNLIDRIDHVLQGLYAENQLQIPSKEKAIAKRTIQKLLDFLKTIA